MKTTWLALGAALAAAGCAGTVDTAPPAPPASFAAGPAAFAGAETAGGPIAPADWVETLGAPEARAFVAEAILANPDLLAAEARASSARERARGQAGRWLPDLDISFGVAETGTPSSGGGDRVTASSATSQLSSRWEADVWGRVLDGVRASRLDAQAAAADLAAARLSVAGQAASAWVDLVEAQQALALAQEDLATRQRALDITQRRFDMGVTGALALRTARSQTAAAQAQLAAQAEATREAARRLQRLVGRYPDGGLAAAAQLPTLDAAPNPGAPAALLARRPDVAAAEARLEAAGLRVSAARKALLPRLTLSAGAAGAGPDIADVSDIDGLVTTLAAGLAAPIFQGGALRAEARASEADRRAAAAAYVDQVLGAWAEVERALGADASLAARERELTVAAEESRAAQDLAEREYARGVATIFELIDSYTRRIDAERALIGARAARVSNRIDYHVALGGGADTGGLSAAPSPMTELHP